MTTPRDSYAWNDIGMVTLLTLSESVAEGGFQPLTITSMRKNLNTSPSRPELQLLHNVDAVIELKEF